MVIISTKAVEVSIQAVSPELILSVPISCGSVGAGSAAAGAAESAGAVVGACAADAAEAGASSAHAAGPDNRKRPITTHRGNFFVNLNPLMCSGLL